MLISGVDEE
jgi:hypothetical protein